MPPLETKPMLVAASLTCDRRWLARYTFGDLRSFHDLCNIPPSLCATCGRQVTHKEPRHPDPSNY